MLKLGLLLLLSSFGSLAAAHEEPATTLVKSQTSFCFSFYEAAAPTNENFVFSPYSIFSGVSMLSIGARGDTATQINHTLNIFLKPALLAKTSGHLSTGLMPVVKAPEGYQFHSANGLWIEHEAFLLADFRRALEDDFQASLQTLNFQEPKEAAKTINEWTSLNTEGMIQDLLEPGDIDANTRAVLTNALYFKGLWSRPFNAALTKKTPFFIAENVSESVSMMETTGSFPYFENDAFQLLALPFIGKSQIGGQMACLVLLPKNASKMVEIESSLILTSFQQWMTHLKPQLIHANLPSFKFSNRISLNDLLKKMGMPKPFSAAADFSGINGMKNLRISHAIHEAVFALDEKGVTAAAATAIAMKPTSMPPQHTGIEFIANHPFLFFIVELNTKTILFMGKLQKPA